MLEREGEELRGAAHAEARADARAVGAHGLYGEAELARDGRARAPLEHEAEDLALPGRERLEERRQVLRVSM